MQQNKKNYKGKKYKKTKKYNKYKKAKPQGIPSLQALVPHYKNNDFFIPPRLRSKFVLGNSGYFVSGTGSNTGAFWLCLNNVNSPEDMSTTLAGSAFANVPNPFHTIGNHVPSGFTALCNSFMYRRYKVNGVSVEIDFGPGGTSDSIFLYLVPLQRNTSVIAYPSTAQWSQIIQDPLTIQKRITPYSQRTVKMYIDLATLNGVTKEQYRNDNTYTDITGVGTTWYFSDNISVVAQVNTLGVFYRTCDNAMLTQNLGFSYKLVYYCEMMDLAVEAIEDVTGA